MPLSTPSIASFTSVLLMMPLLQTERECYRGLLHVVTVGHYLAAPVHPQHRLLHLRAPDDATAANRERILIPERVHVGMGEVGMLIDHVRAHHRLLHLHALYFILFCLKELREIVAYFSPKTNIPVLGANEIYQCRGNAKTLVFFIK